jgi:hypothetical protein
MCGSAPRDRASADLISAVTSRRADRSRCSTWQHRRAMDADEANAAAAAIRRHQDVDVLTVRARQPMPQHGCGAGDGDSPARMLPGRHGSLLGCERARTCYIDAGHDDLPWPAGTDPVLHGLRCHATRDGLSATDNRVLLS